MDLAQNRIRATSEKSPETPMLENGTMPPASQVDALLAQRDQVQSAIAQGQDLLHQIDQAMKALGEWGYSIDNKLTGVDRHLDRLMWQRLLEVCKEHLFIAPLLNGEWDILLKTNTPFVRDEVDVALAAMDERRARMLAGGILMAAQEMYGAARLGQQARVQGLFTYNPPWGANAYRNKVDPRSPRMMGRGLGGDGYFTTNEHKMQHLDALHRLMCLADGVALPAADDLPCNWLNRSDYSAAPWRSYFTVDRYKNGNGRITLLRMDLANQLNACLDEWDLGRAAGTPGRSAQNTFAQAGL